MNIGDIIKHKDIDTYRELQKMCRTKMNKYKETKLGDSVENLMKANSYKREGRRIKQKTWL